MHYHVTVQIDGPEAMVVALRISIPIVPPDRIVPTGVITDIGASIVEEPVALAAALIEPEIAEFDEFWIEILQKTGVR